jgi:CBS domain containing-hemolysin-like protein
MSIEFWNIILGLSMTVITGFLVNRAWSTAIKALTAIVITLVLATVQGLIFGEFTFGTIALNFAKIFAIGEAMYGLYFKELFNKVRGE